MCSGTTVRGAQGEKLRSSRRASAGRVAHSRRGFMDRGSCRYGAGGTGSTIPSLRRRPSEETVNPVRQCARRGDSARGVAQASPLFSDHAPREVHLWQ